MPSKIEYLVVDTSAFIKNTQLQELGVNLITISEVVNEIKSKRQLRRLIVLPYELQVKEVEPENLTFVTNFSKQTGDFPALSITDLKVAALTYQLEKEHVGVEHIRSEPVIKKSVEAVDHSIITAANLVGFHQPSKEEGGHEQEVPDVDEISSKLEGLTCRLPEVPGQSEPSSQDEEAAPVDQDAHEEGCEEEVTADDDYLTPSDDEDWITPQNLGEAKREMLGAGIQDPSKVVKVACLSTDFAVQNVLKQMGLNVVSLDGLLIREVRTFILRCYACFKTTHRMEKMFCPNCGNKTLKRVAVTVGEDGKEKIHINFRRPLTGRGKKFPLPKFQGGKHAVNPIICEDQRVPQQMPTKISLSKPNPLHPDYIAGVSPFVMRDVSSRAAVLGVQSPTDIRYWMRKNPNQVTKRRRKK